MSSSSSTPAPERLKGSSRSTSTPPRLASTLVPLSSGDGSSIFSFGAPRAPSSPTTPPPAAGSPDLELTKGGQRVSAQSLALKSLFFTQKIDGNLLAVSKRVAEIEARNKKLQNRLLKPQAQVGGGKNPQSYFVAQSQQPQQGIAVPKPAVSVMVTPKKEIQMNTFGRLYDYSNEPPKSAFLDSALKANVDFDYNDPYSLMKLNDVKTNFPFKEQRMYRDGFIPTKQFISSIGAGYLQGGYMDPNNNVKDRSMPPQTTYDRSFSGIGTQF